MIEGESQERVSDDDDDADDGDDDVVMLRYTYHGKCAAERSRRGHPVDLRGFRRPGLVRLHKEFVSGSHSDCNRSNNELGCFISRAFKGANH
jgi:hypothetical protein